MKLISVLIIFAAGWVHTFLETVSHFPVTRAPISISAGKNQQQQQLDLMQTFPGQQENMQTSFLLQKAQAAVSHGALIHSFSCASIYPFIFLGSC